MVYNGKELKIYDEDCTRCMHCINLMPKALRPGDQRGATILIGGKAPIVEGALLSWVIVPFMELKPPYKELKDLIVKYRNLKGEVADYIPGWDCHGLPIELKVDKELGPKVAEEIRAKVLVAVPETRAISASPTTRLSDTRAWRAKSGARSKPRSRRSAASVEGSRGS